METEEQIKEQIKVIEVELDSLKFAFYEANNTVRKESKEKASTFFKYLRDYIDDLEFDIENEFEG